MKGKMKEEPGAKMWWSEGSVYVQFMNSGSFHEIAVSLNASTSSKSTMGWQGLCPVSP